MFTRRCLITILGLVIMVNTPKFSSFVTEYLISYEPRVYSMYDNVIDQSTVAVVRSSQEPITTVSDSWLLESQPSISAKQFDAILETYRSPAYGSGNLTYALSVEYNIDHAYILYMFIHESTAGTNPQWIGMKPNGTTTHNAGNIRCVGSEPCYKGFRDFQTWEDGFRAMFELLDAYKTFGDVTIDDAINRWAPPVENDTNYYVESLKEYVSKWRSVTNSEIMFTNKKHKVTDSMIVNAAYNDINCAYWSFQNGPLGACQHLGTDFSVMQGEPVYIPFDCRYVTTGFYDNPSMYGYYVICILEDDYEYYSGHLADAIHLQSGALLKAGTIIGYGNYMVHTHVQLRDPHGNIVDFLEYYNNH